MSAAELGYNILGCEVELVWLENPWDGCSQPGEVWEPLGDKGLGQGEVGELGFGPPLIPVLPFWDLTAGSG